VETKDRKKIPIIDLSRGPQVSTQLCRQVQAALVARVTEHRHGLVIVFVTVWRNRSVVAVNSTGVADKNSLFLYRVSALSMGSTRIDGMLVVEAPADCVAFHNLVAHVEVGRTSIVDSKTMDRRVQTEDWRKCLGHKGDTVWYKR
jgi:hypothetical protein